jgi:hypothetical protein
MTLALGTNRTLVHSFLLLFSREGRSSRDGYSGFGHIDDRAGFPWLADPDDCVWLHLERTLGAGDCLGR